MALGEEGLVVVFFDCHRQLEIVKMIAPRVDLS